MGPILRHFQLDGAAVLCEIGFVPDLVRVHIDDGTNIDIITWMKRMVDDETMYGQLLTGSSGVTTRLTTAATGISEYDTAVQGVRIPMGSSKQNATFKAWTDAIGDTPTARGASTIGTVVIPDTRNGMCYECTSYSGAVPTTEPTWPVVPGETVTDGNSNVWTCRIMDVVQIGKKGITIGADAHLNDDNNQCYVEAYKAEWDPDDLDAADVPAGMMV